MQKPFSHLALVASAFMIVGAPAVAQSSGEELSVEEIRERLLSQSTRGLVIAPAAKPKAEVAAAPAAAPLAPQPATIVELPDDLRVDVSISFDFDSAALRADQAPKVDTMCEVMRSIDIAAYRIIGHTDASGSAGYNETLSRLRAEEVKRYLVSSCGIAAERLEAIGAGEQLLLDQNDPNSDANRRVEFQVVS